MTSASGIMNLELGIKRSYLSGIVKIKSDTFLKKEEVTPKCNNVEEQ